MSQPCCDTRKNESDNKGVDIALPVLPAIQVCSQPDEVQMSLPGLNQPFVIGSIETPVGLVPQVSSTLTWRDNLGTIRARWGVGRMNYAIEPGLYALGNPDSQSNVFVTANYKMSFDRLRENFRGQNAWLLVLDTKGINVWCAAGKGTFGTEELVHQIIANRLNKVVTHRRLILPQLSGPGVAAHLVKKYSGFRVYYGPIRSLDLPVYLDAGCKATREMRLKTFNLRERIALIPIELVAAFKASLLILLAFFLIGGLGGPDRYWVNAMNHGLFAVCAMLAAILAGAVLTPILLPVLPGRAFSLKGSIVGVLVALTLLIISNPDYTLWPGRLEMLAWLLMVPALAAYLAMNFTGASTYTSLSGVKKEMRVAVPLEIGAGLTGLGLWLVSRFIS